MQNKQSNRRRHRLYGLVSVVLGLVLLMAVFKPNFSPILSLAESESQTQEETSDSETQAAQESLTQFEEAIIHALDQAHGAVVSIGNYQDYAQFSSPYDFFLEYYQQEYGGNYGFEDETMEPQLVLASEGSGVVYKVDGDQAYVITNNHVIEDAAEVEVTTRNGDSATAEIVGYDVMTDLAVLKTDASVVDQVIDFADSDQVQIGSLAIAIGSPMGELFAGSVTQGIISAVDREMPVDTTGDGKADWTEILLQTDAAINPGNSGGALVDRQGRLIGINSSKLSDIGVEGMGFAIPSNQVKFIVDQLETKGEVERPVLGIRGGNVEEFPVSVRQDLLNLPEEVETGVAVQGVDPSSSAAQAGLEVYDVIVEINDEPVDDMASLRQILYSHQIGDKVKVTVLRSGFEVETEVTLEASQPAPVDVEPQPNN